MVEKSDTRAMQFHANTSYIAGSLPERGALHSGIAPLKKYLDALPVKLPVLSFPDSYFPEVLFARQSCREFKAQPVTLSNLANILFAGYGVLYKAPDGYKSSDA